jgi:hypothetical protein
MDSVCSRLATNNDGHMYDGPTVPPWVVGGEGVGEGRGYARMEAARLPEGLLLL